MTRVLRRPMFRLGGNTDQGIMSGVAPRQGYATDQEGGSVQSLGDLRNLTIPQLRELAGTMAYQPRGVTPADALIEFGLNVASAEPRGSIFSTAAGAAKEPFQRYSTSKAESEAARYVSEADMFKTLIAAQADVLGSEGGKTYAQTEIAGRVRQLTENIIDARAEIKNLQSQGVEMGPPGSGDVQVNQKRIDELNKQITLDQSELNNLKKRSQYASSMLKSDTFRDGLVQSIMERLAKETLPNGQLKYPGGLSNEKLYQDAFQEMLNFLQETETRVGEATGGRVGYANAGPVMDSPLETGRLGMQPSEDVMTMPEELSGITYEELRARLPQEVSDEIVRLLANSPEALEDFAVIQTEQDIANFNKKYGVNLVLPAGG